jgi:hypothetical protein
MASERRVAHFGLASAGLVMVTTLVILVQGGAADDVVGQERGANPAGSPTAVHREYEAQQASARAMNVAAAINK